MELLFVASDWVAMADTVYMKDSFKPRPPPMPLKFCRAIVLYFTLHQTPLSSLEGDLGLRKMVKFLDYDACLPTYLP